MAMPLDANTRKYYRVARQRLEEAELILTKVELPAAATYLAGYAVECGFKALLLALTPPRERAAMMTRLKNKLGHNLRRLRAGVIERGGNIPRDAVSAMVFVEMVAGVALRAGTRRRGGGGEIPRCGENRNHLGGRKDVAMATIARGVRDAYVDRLKATVDEYEREHPGATAELYRQNTASIRVRIVDERFAHMSKGQRHDDVWGFISARLDDDTLQEISVLLPLAPKELKSSFMSLEFDDPIPAGF